MEFKAENCSQSGMWAVGHKYLTRSGLVVFLAEISANRLDKYPLKGYVIGEENKTLSWLRNGKRYNSSADDLLDLVCEVENV